MSLCRCSLASGRWRRWITRAARLHMHHTAVSTVQDVHSNVQRRLAWVAGAKGTVFVFIACIASVSNRVIARKLEREQKKGGLPRHSFVFALVPTFSTNSFGDLFAAPRTVLSNKSHYKVDFHVLFQYKTRSPGLVYNKHVRSHSSLSLSLSFNCPFSFFNPHPISYTRIDLRRNRLVARDWFD